MDNRGDEREGSGFDLEAALAELRGGGPAQTLATDDDGPEFQSGFVTLAGRPNAGKSTLTNALVGAKIAITSNTAQTTRHRLRGIIDRPGMQVVLVDTPGIHKPHDALGEELNRSAIKGLEDVDVAALLVDASKPFGTGDEWVLRQINCVRCKRMLVVTKTDLVTAATVTKQFDDACHAARFCFDGMVAVSAKTGDGLNAFLDLVAELLPHGPRWFPRGTTTDQPLEVLIAETIREKILRLLREEVPHSVGVQTDMLEYGNDGICRILASIYVERESQKGIVVGRGGGMIKKIGSQARSDIERLLGQRAFLDLKVKVKRDWRRDAAQIRRFGYGEGA